MSSSRPIIHLLSMAGKIGEHRREDVGEFPCVYEVDENPHRVGNERELRERSRVTDSQQTVHLAYSSTGCSPLYEEGCGTEMGIFNLDKTYSYFLL